MHTPTISPAPQHKHAVLALALLAAALILPLAQSATAAGADETVVISGALEPAQLEVAAGTTVTWRNDDNERHRVRSEDGPVRFDSQNLESGESFDFTFTVEGSYPYYDHRDRDDSDYFGMVIVGGVEANADVPLPDSGAVSIIDRSFRPASFSIATGGTIEWSNDDGETHTVTSTDSAFDSGILDAGATFSQDFAEPGSYPYFCLIHPDMRGTVTVSDPGIDPASVVPEAAPEVQEPGTDIAAIATPGVGTATEVIEDTPTAVSVIDRSFQPETLEIAPGDTVTWSNDDTEGHTVTSSAAAFNSGVMTVGDEFSVSFDAAGTFDYFCATHPEMTGTVVVAEPDPAPATD